MKEHCFEVPYSIAEYTEILAANMREFISGMYYNQEGLMYYKINKDNKKITAYLSADNKDLKNKKASSLVFRGKMEELPAGGLRVKGRFWLPWVHYYWVFLYPMLIITNRPWNPPTIINKVTIWIIIAAFFILLIVTIRELASKRVKARNNELLERLLIPEEMLYAYMEEMKEEHRRERA